MKEKSQDETRCIQCDGFCGTCECHPKEWQEQQREWWNISHQKQARRVRVYPRTKGLFASIKRINSNTIDVSVSKTSKRKDAIIIRVISD